MCPDQVSNPEPLTFVFIILTRFLKKGRKKIISQKLSRLLWMWDVIVLIPDHCLSIYFEYITVLFLFLFKFM